MWTDAIELGAVAFLANRDKDDGQVQDWLEALGVEPWLAARLVIWLPVAFGRQLLTGARLSDEYGDGDAIRRLRDDPIFVAAMARAAHMSREEADVIALRSAEVRAINSALRHDSAQGHAPRLEDMESATALVTPLPAIQPSDGGVPEPRLAFAEFLRGHGHAVVPAAGTLQRTGELELDALVFGRVFDDGSYRPQVDYRVAHPRLAAGTLLESFAGFGASYREAVHDTIRKFERGSLHVLIAALLDRNSCGDQVTWEPWGDRWDACLGAQLLLYAEVGPVLLGELLDRLRDAFLAEIRDHKIHAVRVFTMRRGEQVFANEVLLDNDPWPAGQALCAAHAWPRFEPAWGTRLFLMVVPREVR
ncbi:MAG: hypothetical protein IT378_10905 [Sandaracinaceae bacterium]|nr:hypothetical protein [Sandaracinaceae bacterium]